MLRINQSNNTDDEDEALELYDEAIQFFKKAHTLDPGKDIIIIFFVTLHRRTAIFISIFTLIDNEKLACLVAMFESIEAQEMAELDEDTHGEEDDDVEEDEEEEDDE